MKASQFISMELFIWIWIYMYFEKALREHWGGDMQVYVSLLILEVIL